MNYREPRTVAAPCGSAIERPMEQAKGEGYPPNITAVNLAVEKMARFDSSSEESCPWPLSGLVVVVFVRASEFEARQCPRLLRRLPSFCYARASVTVRGSGKVEVKKLVFLLLLIAFSVFMLTREHPLGDLNPGVGKSIVDAHVHVAGLGYGDSGCFINEQMRNNVRFPFYLWAMGVTEEELAQHGDRVLLQKLSDNIAQSETVKKAVVLAMDGYVDDNGELDRDRTQIYVPNDYVARETAKHENLLFGASVNPNRKDAIQRLHGAKEKGAVLVKWIPSIMNIDPSRRDYIPFYKMMAKLKIPLLTHTGTEKSFANARDELSDPVRLKLPLEQGVTVIAAHIATTGESQGQDNFERILPMIRQYPNLYVDISSLTQVNKLNYLARALQEDGVTEKMIYGSDWPLAFFPLISPWYHINHISLEDAYHDGGIENQWDRDVALKTAIGVPDEVFLRTGSLLRID